MTNEQHDATGPEVATVTTGAPGQYLQAAVDRRQFFVGAAGVAALASLTAACGGGTPSAGSSSAAATGKPKKGGNFRLGVTGGGAKDLFDGQNIITKPDQARLVSSFETLLTFDDDYKLSNEGLAEEVVADNPKQYTIKLRQGVEFQNGKTMTADDVIFSLQRIGTKSLGLTGYAATSTFDLKGLKKVDDYTVTLPMKTPDSTVPQTLASYTFGIVPVGYKTYPAEQIGTGPYKLKSFSPGRESVSERHPNYWRDTWFDTVTITNFADSTAQINALLGGQVDAMTDVPASQVRVLEGRQLKSLVSKTGGWVPLCMAVDMAPFDDPKVRQAFRLMVDRKAMVEQVLSGYGFIGNDLYSPFDEGFDSSLPQREQDIEQAKSLLKSAGKEGLTVELNTTNGAAGMIPLATVFAQQAKAAGVTVKVKNVPNYYGDQYLKLPFSVDFWGTRGYLNQVQQGSLPSSPYNETHWPVKSGVGSDFEKLYGQALAETDDTKRFEIQREMQKSEYENGGYIIPFFGNLIDGYSPKVAGFKPSKGTLNLTGFGHGFRDIWFA